MIKLLDFFISLFSCYRENNSFFQKQNSQSASGGKEVFRKKPLGRRWYLISSPVKGCEFSTITSGTERKRGFAEILPCRSVLFNFQISQNMNNFYSNHTKSKKNKLFLRLLVRYECDTITRKMSCGITW